MILICQETHEFYTVFFFVILILSLKKTSKLIFVVAVEFRKHFVAINFSGIIFCRMLIKLKLIWNSGCNWIPTRLRLWYFLKSINEILNWFLFKYFWKLRKLFLSYNLNTCIFVNLPLAWPSSWENWVYLYSQFWI